MKSEDRHPTAGPRGNVYLQRRASGQGIVEGAHNPNPQEAEVEGLL